MNSSCRGFFFGFVLLSNLWTTGPLYATVQCHQTHAQAHVSQLKWGLDFDFEKAEAFLRAQKSFRRIIPMHQYLQFQGKKVSGTSEVYFVEFQNGVEGVWKPDAGLAGPVAEEATYLTARKLGVRNFVPTILTEIDGRHGNLSLFVKTPVDLLSMEISKRNDLWSQVPSKQRADMDLVHFLLGQWDRHFGNMLLDETHNLVVIDNEAINFLSVWRLGEYPFVRIALVPKSERTGLDLKNKTSFPYDQIQFLDGNDPKAIAAFLERFGLKPERLPDREFSRFERRQLPFVIWRDRVWRCRLGWGLPPIDLKMISKETLENLKKMTEADFRSLLDPRVFTDEHIELILQRRDMILNQARNAERIP